MKASVRGMLCVVAILALTLPAAAEMTKTGSVDVGDIAAPRQSTLYDQTANWGGGLSSTQDFEAAYDQYDAEGADDFEVTWADGWNVEQVAVVAGYWNGSGPATAVHVTIYDDAGGMPGAAVCSYPSNAFVDDGLGLDLWDNLGRSFTPGDGGAGAGHSGGLLWHIHHLPAQKHQAGQRRLWRRDDGARHDGHQLGVHGQRAQRVPHGKDPPAHRAAGMGDARPAAGDGRRRRK